jgi:hypothetical protein
MELLFKAFGWDFGIIVRKDDQKHSHCCLNKVDISSSISKAEKQRISALFDEKPVELTEEERKSRYKEVMNWDFYND